MSMALGEKQPVVELNVTPLIDVLLVLIITFMVITPLTPSGLDALVPQPDSSPRPTAPLPAGTVVISIGHGKNIKINHDAVDIRDLGNRLDDIFKNRNERIIFVKGDDSLEFITVARVIDVAKGVGIDKIGLVTESLQESQ